MGIQKITRKSYFSVANTVSYQKRAYFDVTSSNFANFGSEKTHEDEIFGRQDYYNFSQGNPKSESIYHYRHPTSHTHTDVICTLNGIAILKVLYHSGYVYSITVYTITYF